MIDFLADHLGWILLLVAAALIVLMHGVMQRCDEQRKALTAACQADGRKPYECEAMFANHCSGGGGTYVVPMYIQSGRR